MISSYSATELFPEGHSLLLSIHHSGWQKLPLNLAVSDVHPHLEEDFTFLF